LSHTLGTVTPITKVREARWKDSWPERTTPSDLSFLRGAPLAVGVRRRSRGSAERAMKRTFASEFGLSADPGDPEVGRVQEVFYVVYEPSPEIAADCLPALVMECQCQGGSAYPKPFREFVDLRSFMSCEAKSQVVLDSTEDYLRICSVVVSSG
jgi:hypothetical protein